MPHFFINSNQIVENQIKISDKENYQHIARSLRIKVGEKLMLIDENQVQYETVVNLITNSTIITDIKNQYPSKRYLDFDLNLAQSPLRNSGQEFIIEKATELGVSNIYPVKTDYCTLGTNVIDKKVVKWQKIMYESSKQCERAIVPICQPCTTLKILLMNNHFDKIFVFGERIASKTIRDVMPIQKKDKILVVIGPEGGFSDKEFEYFNSNDKIDILTLGDLILRAETATTVALGNIIYEYTNTYR